MIKHYVMYCFPGIMFSEYTSQEIDSRREPLTDVPDNCYGYYFYDREEIVSKKTGEKLTGKKIHESGMRYFGEVFTLEEIKSKFPELKTLIYNLKGSYKKAVKTRCGNWQSFGGRDKIVN